MVISAEDGGGLTAPVNARVNVSIVGGSVASPVFEQVQDFFTVPEDVLRGTAVGVVRAAAKTGVDTSALKSSDYVIFFLFTLWYVCVCSASSRCRIAFISLLYIPHQWEHFFFM